MREERLLSYLKGACPGRKYRVGGAELERALGLSGLLGAPAQAQRSGLRGERRSDGAGELFAARRKRASAVRDDERKLINRLRRKGVPIASDRQGYFYAVTAGEVYTTIRLLRKMVAGIEKAIAGLEAALEKFGEMDRVGGDSP